MKLWYVVSLYDSLLRIRREEYFSFQQQCSEYFAHKDEVIGSISGVGSV